MFGDMMDEDEGHEGSTAPPFGFGNFGGGRGRGMDDFEASTMSDGVLHKRPRKREMELKVGLEELYKGATKKLKVCLQGGCYRDVLLMILGINWDLVA